MKKWHRLGLAGLIALGAIVLMGTIKPSRNGRLQTVESDTTFNVAGTLQISGTAVTSTAIELNAVDGITSTVAELNILDGTPADITLAAAAGGSNVCEVTITVKDAAAATLGSVFNLDVWLSDAATGAGLTGTSASGTVTVKSASGAVIGTYSAKKALRVQTLATGIFTLEITDSAKTAFYVVVSVPTTGATVVSTQLVTGDYG